MAIITSLLDTDLYKFTMMQTALHQFSTTTVEYSFKCRNKANWTAEILEEINAEVDNFCSLKFSVKELNYLGTIPFMKKDFIDFLGLYKPNREHITLWLDDEGELQVFIKGPWYLTLPFEVPVLAIINQIYFEKTSHIVYIPSNTDNPIISSGLDRLNEKFKEALLSGVPFSDFGTRRRYSFLWQETVLKKLKELPGFTGTSNVYYAMKYNLRPIGTMAHEFIMAGAGQNDVPLIKSQQKMLQAWVDEYRGDLGIAISETYGIDAFLNDFDLYFAKLYDGVRHDSGEPIAWANKMIKHYEQLEIDPKAKTLIFSDDLTVTKAADIYKKLSSSVKVAFGIGTNLTNDFQGITPLQIVIKLISCNNRPVAKLSDSPGKGMCKDENFLTYLKDVFNINA
jgi:nicotinate phosphoribosyltransferase